MAVERDRYQELLGCLLDGELSGAEAEELAQMLTSQPAWRRDFREHLVLWDLWAQQAVPERSAAAFVAAWKTRLAAEAGGDAFGAAVRARLEAADPRPEPRGPGGRLRNWWGAWRAAWPRPVGLAWATMTGAAFAAVLWLVLPRSARATVTIHGEAVCTACVLHQTHDCHEAIRVIEGKTTRVYYLDPDPRWARLQGRFCNGPTTAVATGREIAEGGRLRFKTDSIELPEGQKAREPPKKDERILFPL